MWIYKVAAEVIKAIFIALGVVIIVFILYVTCKVVTYCPNMCFKRVSNDEQKSVTFKEEGHARAIF